MSCNTKYLLKNYKKRVSNTPHWQKIINLCQSWLWRCGISFMMTKWIYHEKKKFHITRQRYTTWTTPLSGYARTICTTLIVKLWRCIIIFLLLFHWQHSTSVWWYILVERASAHMWILIHQLPIQKYGWGATVLHRVGVQKCSWHWKVRVGALQLFFYHSLFRHLLQAVAQLLSG